MSDEIPAPPVPPPPSPPPDPRIGIEEFSRVEMRAAQVLEAEKVQGSRKLVRLKVDLGTETRQVVAGIADSYDPATLVGRKVVVVANLKPARLMGIESNGMVVAANFDGKAVLATFAEDVPNGAILK